MRIKIISIPKGEVPKEIRAKWVGLELTGNLFEPFDDFPLSRGCAVGLVTGIEQKEIKGLEVPVEVAIQALATHNREAFSWWLAWSRQHLQTSKLIFDSGCYKIIEP